MRSVILIVLAVVVAGVLWSQFGSDANEPVESTENTTAIEPQVAVPADSGDGLDPEVVAQDPDPEEPAGPRRIVVGNQSDFFSIMGELGLDEMEQRFSKWSLEHGYPFSDQTGVLLLEQPYDQYDDDTLRAFAENEDMWAQQFLAQRLENTRPAEAIDWYRKAAINGSLFAMDQLTALYGKLARARADGPNTDATYKEQLLAVRDSTGASQEMGFAWSMASVMAGGDPGRNKLTMDAMSRSFDDEQVQRACDLASSLYSDISSQRQNRGLPDYSRSPPPLMMGTISQASDLPCGGESSTPYMDVSGCEEVVMVLGGSESEMVVCRN